MLIFGLILLYYKTFTLNVFIMSQNVRNREYYSNAEIVKADLASFQSAGVFPLHKATVSFEFNIRNVAEDLAAFKKAARE